MLSLMFVAAGLLHFIFPLAYLRLMPPYLPWHLPLVYLSGAAAAWGLAALLVAVLPANIYMATAHLPAPWIFGQHWAQWLRIPMQVPLFLWALRYSRD